MATTALLILDGFGIGKPDPKSNAIYAQGTPHLDALKAKYSHTAIGASGLDVGLPDGQMGNSEVGHTNIGAGRVVYQELTRITKSIRDGDFFTNPALVSAMENARTHALHLIGLVSDGGVHSHNTHLYALIEMAKRFGVERVFVHCLMDGRDVPPTSGVEFIKQLEAKLGEIGVGKIATISGRYYGMDREKRWERVEKAYAAMVYGEGNRNASPVDTMTESYANDVTDEFIKPIVITGADGQPLAKIEEGDAVIFMNFRNDRAREITAVLTQNDMPDFGMKVIPNLYYCCMTPYDASFTGLHILFDKELVQDTLGEVVSKAGKRQLRIAETEKYAHVTFFFNGGRETPFENEDRILVNSPKVATYDLQPEMSAPEVTEKLVEAINTEKEDLIILNFANGDMVGHTGVYDAICKAVKCIDGCVEKVVNAAIEHGYAILLTADHGNADNAVNPDGSPNTAHSLNLVQFIVINAGDDVKEVKDGALCNVAPTILKLMGIPQPAAMEAEPLI